MTRQPAKKSATKSKAKAVTSSAILKENENEKALRALELRRSGKTWWQVAKALDISQSYAANLVHEALSEAAQLVDYGTKQQLLALEIDRLDTLQQAVWTDAVGGDLKAIEIALKIIQSRTKVLGLDNMPTNTVTNNTIVVTGTSEEYITALRRVQEIPAQEITEG